MKHVKIETRSDEPIEVRDDAGGGDALGTAVEAINELRATVTTSATETRGAVESVRGEVAAIAARVDALEVRAQRPGAAAPGNGEPPIELRAFRGFLRHGREALAAEEVRALRVSDSTAGGYLAPEDFVRELDRNLVLTSPVRAAARIASTSAGNVVLPKRTSGLTASWVGETETRPETESAYGQTDLPVCEIAAYVDVSNALLEDSAFNLEAELAFNFAEEFGRLEGAAFVSGDGAKKPVGILNTTGIDTVPSGDANTITADGIIDLVYDLPSPYAAGAAFGMRRSTMAAVRKLKSSSGDYLWSDSLQAGQPPSLLGYPVIEMPDLPAIAASAKPIVFGNFSHFRIFDRVSVSIMRDPYSVATTGKTRFHGRRRLAAGVTKAEAFRLMTISAS